MKIKGLRYFVIFFSIIVILLTNNSLAVAQPKDESSRKGLIHLQFSLTISWNASETEQPISPGQIRVVTLDVAYTVNKALLGGFLLHLLEGRSFPIQLSIEDKPDWCEAWLVPETMTGVVDSEEIGIRNSLLCIHVNEDAPTNHTIGEIGIQCKIDDMKGPFKILTLIGGFEQFQTLYFMTGP